MLTSIQRLSFHNSGADWSRDILSAVVQAHNSLWVISGKRNRLDCFAPTGGVHFKAMKSFDLDHFLADSAATKSANRTAFDIEIESAAFDGSSLWVVGSHSLSRALADPFKPDRKNILQLQSLVKKKHRFVLARIPVAIRQEDETRPTVELLDEADPEKVSRLAGTADGNELTDAIAEDEHFQPFLAIPGDENGLAVGGIAVYGNKVFLGLRGPVLHGWGILLELEVEEDPDHILHLKPIGPDGQHYRKHFLQLDGLGIRDLCLDGQDLLLLARPSQDFDWPVMIYRWYQGVTQVEERLVWSRQGSELTQVICGPRTAVGTGYDRPHSLSLVSNDEFPYSVLVGYEAPSPYRLPRPAQLDLDLFRLTQ